MDAAKASEGAAAVRPLEYLPIGLFGSVMGLTGLSVAFRLAQPQFGLPGWPADIVAAIAVIAFVVLTGAYAVKLGMAPDAALAEFRHPIAGSLFGTFLISLLLLPLLLAPLSLLLARALWLLGAVGMLAFAVFVVDRWLGNRMQPAQVAPAWVVPVVGLLDIPLALPVLDWPELQPLKLLALAVGLFFALPLFTMIFSRLMFEPPMPPALRPSLLILLAPFAVGTSSYLATVGRFDLFAQGLFALSMFMFAVLVWRLRDLAHCCPFRIAWWAVSFPLASAAIAALRCAAAFPTAETHWLAAALLLFATVVILGLLVRTLAGVARGELRALSG